MSSIRFENVGVTFADADQPVLSGIDLTIDAGELVLVVGRTGSGKSTLLGTINGLVPHFTGGTLSGRVLVHDTTGAWRETSTRKPRDFADLVGVVGQDPAAGFVTDTVEEELAYGMEQLGLAPDVMRRRVEETLDLLGIADLRNAPLTELSGGQQQRVAIGSVLTTHPRVLVLDEPTSALDPTGAEEVLAAITRLVHDLAVTVVLAEHRVERVLQYADRVLHVVDGTAEIGDPATIMATATVAPPIVELGRWAGWSPLPLSVRDAVRKAGPLRARLGDLTPAPRQVAPAGEELLRADRVVVRHGDVVAVNQITVAPLRAATITALMGRNGCGKSSLLWALQGSGARSGGTVAVLGADPAELTAPKRRALVGLVPQTPGDLLYLPTVGQELRQADDESGAPSGTARAFLDRLVAGLPDDRHPRDLSEGQRLALVLAVQLAARPRVLLLDEPTRGLDYPAKAALAQLLRELADDDMAVLLSTHDVEFAAECVDRVLLMAEGDLLMDAPVAEALPSSPAFAPQVTKVLGAPWLTVEDVRRSVSEPAT